MIPFNIRFSLSVEVFVGSDEAVVVDEFFVVDRLIVLGGHFVVGGGVSRT